MYLTGQDRYLERAIWIATTSEDTLLDVRLFLSKLYPSDLAHMLVPMPPKPNYSNNHNNELAKIASS
jgi:hypothetical protein